MSGKAWTEDRKVAQSKRMKARWRNPEYRAAQTAKNGANNRNPVRRADASGRMKRLNARMRDDDKLRHKCIRGQKRVRRSPEYRAIQSAVMADIMSRPEMKRAARLHCKKINRNPRVRRRQWAGRRKKKAQRNSLSAPLQE